MKTSMKPRLRTLSALISLAALLTTASACSDDTALDRTPSNNAEADAISDTGAQNNGGADSGHDSGTHQDTGSDSGTEQDTGPQCAAENICGSACCTTGELCLQDQCVTPGEECVHTLQCPDGQICEPTLERCIPRTSAEACIYKPDTDIFDPIVQVAWHENLFPDTPEPSHKQIYMTPIVLDINGNGTPDIIFANYSRADGNNNASNGILRAVDGRTYEPVFNFIELEKRVHPNSAIAAGDIDGDGHNEIIAVNSNGQGLIAFDDYTTDFAIKWTTINFGANADGPSLADLDGDGNVEVISRNRVFSGKTGEQLCVNTQVGTGANHSIAVDLDGDGKLEVLAGNGAFKFEPDGNGGYTCPTYWMHEFASGAFAVGDFGTFTGDQRDFNTRDGVPEIVTVNTSTTDQLQIVNGQTGKRIWSVTLPTDGHPIYTDTQCSNLTGAGSPTVADFDGDGRAEIAMAGACFYLVYNNDGTLLWRMPTRDFSSRITGSSVFDFQGDGRAEVVYADECFLRVYDGRGNGDGTSTELFKVSNTSGTARELPVIVDVDGDFHADIVVMSNDDTGVPNQCRNNHNPEFDELGGPVHGVRVIKDRHNRWVSTRPVWNQHAYHVTNVCDGLVDDMCPGTPNTAGAIPRHQIPNHATTHLNNFRQNVQGDGLFNAPDLVITNLEATCTQTGLEIHVTVGNQGDRGVLPGLYVTLYAEIEGTERFITTLETTQHLPPGARETLTYAWNTEDIARGDGQDFTIRAHADQDEDGNGQHNECIESNNELHIDANCGCRSNDDCQEGYYCHPTTSVCTRVLG